MVLTVSALSTSRANTNDTFRMVVVTQTGRNKNDGTDDLRLVALINGEEEHRQRLDNPGRNDFEVGAEDRFENLEYNFPLEQVERVVIKAESGKDAWCLREISFQFFQGDQASEVYSFKTKTWLSAEKADKGDDDKAFRFRKPIILK
jgi:hypothetical protein